VPRPPDPPGRPPGDARDDPALTELSTLPDEAWRRLWAYLSHGGVDNAEHCLRYAATLLGRNLPWAEPRPLPPAALYLPGTPTPTLADVRATWRGTAPWPSSPSTAPSSRAAT
jgi:cobaltochelatase CobN